MREGRGSVGKGMEWGRGGIVRESILYHMFTTSDRYGNLPEGGLYQIDKALHSKVQSLVKRDKLNPCQREEREGPERGKGGARERRGRGQREEREGPERGKGGPERGKGGARERKGRGQREEREGPKRGKGWARERKGRGQREEREGPVRGKGGARE